MAGFVCSLGKISFMMSDYENEDFGDGQRLLHNGRAPASGVKLGRSWVRFPPGSGHFLFSLSLSLSSAS